MCMVQIPDVYVTICQKQIDQLIFIWPHDHRDSLNIKVNWMNVWVRLPVINFEFIILVLLQTFKNYHHDFSFSDHIITI